MGGMGLGKVKLCLGGGGVGKRGGGAA